MIYVALRMLVYDRAKYLGLIFSIGFASFLISHQASIFSSLMARTTSQINDVTDATIWVMDPRTQNFDDTKPLNDNDLLRVRAVPGVEWGTSLFKANARAKTADGLYRNVVLLGVDDATMVGAPRNLKMGTLDALREPQSIVLDDSGFSYLFPGQTPRLGDVLELNDRRARVVGINLASAPFITLPIVYTRFSEAVNFVGRERNTLSFVLVKHEQGTSAAEVIERIKATTGLKALTGDDFGWLTIWYYIGNTGIPINFGITVCVAILVGTVVSGQTFYIFTIENLKQFAALKAIGVGNIRILQMVMLQAAMVGLIGFGLGMAGCATFFLATGDVPALRGFILRWEVLVGTGVLISGIVLAASLLSLHRLITLEPAVVFRG